MKITYGDIVIVDLSPIIGSEQGGTRPCIIVQNDVGNVFSHTTIIVPITSSLDKKYSGNTHFFIGKNMTNNLSKDGVGLCEQVRCVDKARIKKKIGKLGKEEIVQLRRCIKICIPVG